MRPLGEAPRPRRRRRRRGRDRGRDREHVRGVLERARAPRPRPPRLRPGRLRRRRPGRGVLPRRGVPHPARRRAAVAGHALRPGRDDRRRQERLRQDAPPAAVGDVGASCSPPSARSSSARARRWLAEEAPAVSASALAFSADLRYVGQAFQIEVPIDAGLARGRHHRPPAGGLPRPARAALRARRPRGRRRADRPPRHDHGDDAQARAPGGAGRPGPGDAGRPPRDPLPEAAARGRRLPPARPPRRPAPRRAGRRRAGGHHHAGPGRLPRLRRPLREPRHREAARRWPSTG